MASPLRNPSPDTAPAHHDASRRTPRLCGRGSLGRRVGRWGAALALALCAAPALAACGSASSSPPAQTTANARQTIVFAVQGGTSGGLGSEGRATADEIAGFERAHPNITVKVLPLSSASVDQARQQVTQYFLAGDSTPDVIDSDITWSAPFGQAGWIAKLDRFHPRTGVLFNGQLAGGTYKGATYELPWYFNAEGLYYRTDLVKHPPRSPAELVADARQALARDKRLKEGVAFEGAKYEGLVTVLVDVLGGFGGKLDPARLDSPANVRALQFLHDLVYTYHVSPQAVTSWQEQDVQNAYTGGQAVFATNWPYVLQGLNAPGQWLKSRTGYIPFPSRAGTPTATSGGDMLAINARSAHQAAAYALIQWLEQPSNQAARAIASGDPPAVRTAYTPRLFKRAPYFRVDERLFRYATSRPVSPAYSQISSALQDMVSNVLSNQQPPAQALKATAARLASLQP